MHIVTYDTSRFSTVAKALQSSDGIAVLGVMFEVIKFKMFSYYYLFIDYPKNSDKQQR